MSTTTRRHNAADQAVAYLRGAGERFVDDLAAFVRFPSVSAQPAHAVDIERCALWLADHLRTIGLEHVRIARTRGHPIVQADWLHAPRRDTVLIYGHYDVQPAEPLGKWVSSPFEPAVRGNELYGRGASDDKGQLFVHVKAIESYLRSGGSLPVNVKCLFEGEEEIGSPNLAEFVAAHRHELVAQCAVLSDTPILAPDRPAITYGLRGGLSMELEIATLEHDLHSGNFGGAVHNAIQVLSDVLASLHDKNGRIAIADFYDRVLAVSSAERTYLQRNGPSDWELLRSAGGVRAAGEPGYTAYERTAIRPALSITGIQGGYSGPGVKAVIPARASAKLNFRLVPQQEPDEIERLFRTHVGRVISPSVRFRIRTGLSARPVLLRWDHSVMRAAASAYQSSFDQLPVLIRSGGTIPVAALLQDVLRIPTVLMGFALPDDRMHAPNERFRLPMFFRGIKTSIQFLAEMSKRSSAAPGRERVLH